MLGRLVRDTHQAINLSRGKRIRSDDMLVSQRYAAASSAKRDASAVPTAVNVRRCAAREDNSAMRRDCSTPAMREWRRHREA